MSNMNLTKLTPKFLRFFIAVVALSGFTHTTLYAQTPDPTPATSSRQNDDPPPPTLFISEDGRMSVELPAGWMADGGVDGFRVLNNPDILNDGANDDAPGSRAFQVLPLSKERIEAMVGKADATLDEVAAVIGPSMAQEGRTLGEPASLKTEEGPAIRISILDDLNEGAIYVIDALAPDITAVIFLVGLPGEFDEAAETELLDIASTVQYSLELTETFEASDGSFSFTYPVDWLTLEMGSGAAMLGNSRESFLPTLTDNFVRFSVFGYPPAVLASGLSEAELKEVAVGFAEQVAASNESPNPVVGEGQVVEHESLTGTVIYVEMTNDNESGGLFFVDNGEVVYAVIFAGASDVGDDLWLTALNIATSVAYTPAE